MLSRFLIDTAIRGYVRNLGVFVQVVADNIRDVGVNDLVIGDPAAGRIGDADITSAPRAHETRNTQHGLAIERLRIQEQIVDPPVDHIYLLEAVDGQLEPSLMFEAGFGWDF